MSANFASEAGVKRQLARLVYHHPNVHRFADFSNVSHQAILTRLGQIMRQQQQTLCAQTLCLLCQSDGLTRRAANTRQNWHLTRTSLHRSANDVAVFSACQRKEFTGATRSKQSTRTIRRQPFETFDVRRRAEVALLIKVSNREGKQTRRGIF